MIPPRLIRTVPAETTREVEGFWSRAQTVHPDWEHLTFRDPIDTALFPTTSPHWHRCTSGAQLAGLVRLEALLNLGGVYIDSDVEVYHPFDSLLQCSAFAAWEDRDVVPDAVIGAEAGHPAIAACIKEALRRLDRIDDPDWHTGSGAWSTGPGTTTSIFPGRTDVLLLPPAAFYPYHYTERDERRHEDHSKTPGCFAAHHWNASWLVAA